MKNVVLASFLACAVTALGVPSAFAQDPASGAQAAPAGAQAAPAAAAPAAPAACPPMPDPEYKAYTDAMNQTTPPAKATAIDAYLAAFPQSCVKQPTLVILMLAYYQAGNPAKTLESADRVLQVDPVNPQALLLETVFRRQSADALTDPAAKQAALDTVASYAQKGLVAPKPADMSDANFKTFQALAIPALYSAIGDAAKNKKDAATAIDAYKKELASVPVDQTKVPGPLLEDTYYLGQAYVQATPPDFLSCAFYASRAAAYAPDNFKTIISPYAKYCYKKYHGADDGYDAVLALATANLNPPADFASTVKAAPTPAEQIHTIITSTPPDQLGSLAIADKELVFQFGSPEDAGKVWDSIKGKSVQIPNALVIASTPTQLQVAVETGAVGSKTADFTFNMKAPDAEPTTAAAKAAYAKSQAAIADATQVGKTVTLSGTYDSFTPSPLMITMSNGEVVLKAAPKAAAKPAAGVHHPAARKK